MQSDIAGLLRKHSAGLSRLSLVMVSAVVSRSAQLGVVMIVARKLTPAEFGLFVFALGAAVVAGIFGNLGWQFSFNRFYAIIRKQDDISKLRGLLIAANRTNLIGSALISLILLGASQLFDHLSYGLLVAALMTIPSAVTILRRQQLAGTGQAAFALMLDQGLASIVLLIAVLILPLTMTEMLAIYTLALVGGNLVATVLVRRRLPEGIGNTEPSYDLKNWMRVSFTLLQSRAARMLLSRLDVLLLPTLASFTAAGIYGAALRATYILTFPQFVLQTINGPQFAEAFASGNMRRVRRTLKLSLAFALVTSSLPLAIFLIAPSFVMVTLFGSQYADAAWPLVLVALGQFAMGIGIPFNAMSVMSGKERSLAKMSISVLVASIGISFVIIPPYGAIGAGIVTALSGFALLAGQVWLARPHLRKSTELPG